MDNLKEQDKLFLMRQTYGLLTSLAAKLDKQNQNNFKELSSRQYLVILALLHIPQGKTSMMNISKILGTSKQNINQLLSALKKKGYIKISDNENDKRTLITEVTETGLEAMKEHARQCVSFLDNIFDDLSEKELTVLLKLLTKLHNYDGIEYYDIENTSNKSFEI